MVKFVAGGAQEGSDADLPSINVNQRGGGDFALSSVEPRPAGVQAGAVGVPLEAKMIMRTAFVILVSVLLSACGAAKAARDTGQLFDKYGCLARELKGQTPCKQEQ